MNQLSDRLVRAPVLQRSIAKVIDFAIMLALAIALEFPIVHSGSWRPLLEPIGFPIVFAYWLLADALPNGQSIGKRLLRIRVAGASPATSCTVRQACLRNLVLQLLSPVELLLIIFSEDQRRLGDRIAGTNVIRLHPLPEPPPTPLMRPVDWSGVRSTVQKIHEQDR